jgi:hypothetical protein
MTPEGGVHLMGHGEDQMEIWNGQHLSFSFHQPLFCPWPRTLGTTAIEAGVIRVVQLAAVLTLKDVSAQDFRATVFDGLYGLALAFWHARAELVQICWTIQPEDIGYFWHDLQPVDGLQVLGKLVD